MAWNCHHVSEKPPWFAPDCILKNTNSNLKYLFCKHCPKFRFITPLLHWPKLIISNPPEKSSKNLLRDYFWSRGTYYSQYIARLDNWMHVAGLTTNGQSTPQDRPRSKGDIILVMRTCWYCAFTGTTGSVMTLLSHQCTLHSRITYICLIIKIKELAMGYVYSCLLLEVKL